MASISILILQTPTVMPGKWTAEDDVVLLLAVIKECNCKPNWANIVTAMGNKFTAEGIRYVFSSILPFFPFQSSTSPCSES